MASVNQVDGPEEAASRPSHPPHPRPGGRWSFRIYMFGAIVAWIGDRMDLPTLNWAVLALTDSPLNLGLINVCRLAPVFAMSVPAGILADRHDRRRLLLVLTCGMMVLTFVVALLVANGHPFGRSRRR
jgi:MFS transporter, DHA1 family, staphyloferrin A biosynthesis exporter